MIARRLIGLLTMLVMLHLMVGGGDTCVAHERDGAMSHMHAGGASGAMAAHAPDGGDSRAPCDAAVATHCCDALTGCGASAAPSVATREMVATRVAVVIPAATTGHLLTRGSGPEPPPPRA